MVISAIKKNKAERERFILGTMLNRKGLLNKVIFEWRPEGREVCIPKEGLQSRAKDLREESSMPCLRTSEKAIGSGM